MKVSKIKEEINMNQNQCKVIIPKDILWVQALRNLLDSKEITIEQYGSCLRRIRDSREGFGTAFPSQELSSNHPKHYSPQQSNSSYNSEGDEGEWAITQQWL